MSFIWFNMLWLLAIVPVLIITYLLIMRRKKKTALRYANLSIVKQAMGAGAAFRRHIPPFLLLTAITLMLLAVARPAAVITLTSNRSTVMLAMDVSGSMRAQDAQPNRITASQNTAKAFIKDQPKNVQIGVVAFAATALLVQSPTLNRDDLYKAIDRFELQRGTNIGGGILVALSTLFPDEEIDAGIPGMRDQFSGDPFGGDPFGGPYGGGGSGTPLSQDKPKTEKKKPPAPVAPGSYKSAVIILLTDGAATTGPDPVEAARLAANHGVRVFTIGFGSTDGDVVGFGGRFMRAQLDEDSLKQVADITKASYYHAVSAEDLKKVYDALNTQLMKETKETEITAFFAAAAAVFAVLSGLLSLIWFNRVF